MMAETEGVIPPGFAKRIEKDLQYKLGVTRRLALVYLEKPFKETVARVENDRGFAVAAAAVAHALEGHIESYEALLNWLKIARARLGLSIAVREDMEAVVAEAEADNGAATRLLGGVDDPGQKP